MSIDQFMSKYQGLYMKQGKFMRLDPSMMLDLSMRQDQYMNLFLFMIRDQFNTQLR